MKNPEEKIEEEPKYIKIIPPFHKGIQLPETLKWLTINPKPHKLTETMLQLEIEGLNDNIQKLSDELSHLRKRKHKEDSHAVEITNPDVGNIKEESIKFDNEQEPRKKYQKMKRVCPCCNVVVIRHFCPHTVCEKDCPIKLAYLKKKTKLELSK